MQPHALQDLHRQSGALSQLMTFTEVCNLLRKSRSGIYKLMAADPTFPRPIKEGESRQSRTYFSCAEVAEWQQMKLEARDAA